METKQCLFCANQAEYNEETQTRNVTYNCPNCGKYEVNDLIDDGDINPDIEEVYNSNRHLISGLIREKNDRGLFIGLIKNENILSLINDGLVPKTVSEKIDKLLLYFYRNSKEFGLEIAILPDNYAIAYAKSEDELKNMCKALVSKGNIECIGDFIDGSAEYNLTLLGIEKAESIINAPKNSKKVFVAMGFKKDLLDAFEKAIYPACDKCGFKAELVSDKEHNNSITDEIIAGIKESRFVIADLTYNNSGAYFEAGFAQGKGLEVIRTCKKKWFEGKDENGKDNKLHFDVNHYNFILWEDHEDFKENLINRIRATIS